MILPPTPQPQTAGSGNGDRPIEQDQLPVHGKADLNLGVALKDIGRKASESFGVIQDLKWHRKSRDRG